MGMCHNTHQRICALLNEGNQDFTMSVQNARDSYGLALGKFRPRAKAPLDLALGHWIENEPGGG